MLGQMLRHFTVAGVDHATQGVRIRPVSERRRPATVFKWQSARDPASRSAAQDHACLNAKHEGTALSLKPLEPQFLNFRFEYRPYGFRTRMNFLPRV
jgi:hypothetical protein